MYEGRERRALENEGEGREREVEGGESVFGREGERERCRASVRIHTLVRLPRTRAARMRGSCRRHPRMYFLVGGWVDKAE